MFHARTRLALLILMAAAAASTGVRAPSLRQSLAVTTGDVRAAADRVPDAAERARRLDNPPLSVPPESFIAALIESTSAVNIRATIERLESFETRYVVSDSCLASARWIRDRFIEYGYAETRMDTFTTWTWQDSVRAVNVIACKRGATRPSEYVILGGHYDSVTTQNFDDPDAPAPGAEDNASGVACVLEAARVLAGVETDRSVLFACWSAEEEGLWGSRAFVADAVAGSTSVFIYLNVDCIGYGSPPLPDGVVYADSSALALAAWICDIARSHTAYALEPEVQPLGASDQNSFWEAGYNVVDTAVEPSSPYMHTPNDVSGNLSVELATAVTALNIVATAAAAGVVGQDANLPPETSLVSGCAAVNDAVSPSPTFEWTGADLDGAVEAYEYTLAGEGAPETWTSVPGTQRSASFAGLPPGEYDFRVRAVDDDGAKDPSPAGHAFTVSDTFSPYLAVGSNFLPGPLLFHGEGGANGPQSVYENEFLIFRLDADAAGYCGLPESVAFAVGTPPGPGDWFETPREFTFRPTLEDTIVHFAARDADGALTTGALRLAPVEATMDRPLLQIDDWYGGDVPEAAHDAFYDEVFLGHERDVWDPVEHLEEGRPTLPDMEEVGRYRAVMWSVGPGFGFLRAAQAESAYHYFEGYVRAGGDLILEGMAPITALVGREPFEYDSATPLPEFVVTHAGVDSVRNAGGSVNASYPDTYGWAFLGGIAIHGSCFDDVPVDTLGKWHPNYILYGGVPWCETARPAPGTRRIYLFDSFLNPTLRDAPCATLTYPDDATGMFAYFGFPFYYLREAPTAALVDALLGEMADWHEPSQLVFFDHDAVPSSVTLTWYLNPPHDPEGCHIERGPAGAAPDGYARLNTAPILPGPGGRFTFQDETVKPATEYSYRLRVVEKSGEETLRGPWAVSVPDVAPRHALELPVPNPAPRSVGIHYSVGQDHCWVEIDVYDCAGRLVRTLEQGAADAGEYDVVWDATDGAGHGVASGVYFVRARIGGSAFHRKVVILR